MFMYVRMYVCIYRVHVDVGLMGAVQEKYIGYPLNLNMCITVSW